MITHAVVICTRNRPDDLAETLASVVPQAAETGAVVLLVDASDEPFASRNRATCETAGVYWRHFDGAPSLARQRNDAIDALPPPVDLVHFLDDDVTLEDGYLERITGLMRSRPELVGAGGTVYTRRNGVTAVPDGKRVSFLSRLLLIDSDVPGRVLASGATTPSQGRRLAETTPVEWLGGCSSYRRDIVERLRFDQRLEGYSLDEDLDFSYRASRTGQLVILPSARLVHRLSPTNRSQVRRRAHDAMVHRYWFIEKNRPHPLAKPAFWWAAFGRLGASLLSRRAHAGASRSGRLSAMWTILTRHHYLLSRRP